MYIKQLDIHGLRNLIEARLEPGPNLNFLCGPNASGKTTVLEAIYLLGRGRSFRTRLLKPVINHDRDSFTVFGVVSGRKAGSMGSESPMGVTRSNTGASEYKVRGERVSASSALAEALPLQLLNSDSFGLLEGGPGLRRRYLDWGVFHVEHAYGAIWKRAVRCLVQRNALLRRAKMALSAELDTWDTEFVDVSNTITEMRIHYLARLIPAIEAMADHFGVFRGAKLHLGYYRGWDKDRLLSDVLMSQRERDRATGSTHAGPHRADLSIRVGSARAADVLSRGQIKLLIIVMIFAQGVLYRQWGGRRCVYLLDDLGAELDFANLQKVGLLLEQQDVQAFVTSTELRSLEALRGGIAPRVFHVEHGQLHRSSA